ncbi:FecR family protein [Reichenbachiella agariperforans]|uniref:FecR family protein n=1 Tax=Reichenbachiella agariperforans TaxID=156994 RepID=UPI001C09DA16|nr:FecR domain-containing protein [Reichenbachiella agariperforans]MBU2915374.1 FecR domain-containing protein [Reichenbachiella agariperforans]
MSTHNNDTDPLIQEWMQGNLTDDDLEQRIGREELRKYQQILSEVDQWTPSLSDEVFDPREILDRKSAKVVPMINWRIISVAASVAVILTLGFLFFRDTGTEYYAAYGEQLEFELPDGSDVVLAANSTVRWEDEDWSGETRRLVLDGKAFFKVIPGSKFSVMTDQGSVEVLGTAFDVSTFGVGMWVNCYEGRVLARDVSKSKAQIIKAGQSSLLVDGSWERIVPIKDESPLWLGKKPTFKNTPILLVIKEIESLYHVKVITGEVDMNRRFTGSIPTDDLSLALKIVFGTLGIQFEIDEDQVLLSQG